MREDVSLTCINCPLGCEVTVHFLENGEMQVSGNSCPRGEIYAKKEVTAPERIVTSSVRVSGGERPVVSVKTKETIPKGKIFDVMEEIRKEMHFTTLHYNRIDDMIESLKLDPDCLCTYCWTGKE